VVILWPIPPPVLSIARQIDLFWASWTLESGFSRGRGHPQTDIIAQDFSGTVPAGWTAVLTERIMSSFPQLLTLYLRNVMMMTFICSFRNDY
jgi:hypothetical protein